MAVADQINQYLRSKGSPLAGYGAAFVAAGQKYGVDPRLIVAISGQETSFGKYKPSQGIKNAWGYGPGVAFPSWEAGIDKATWNISSPVYAGRNTIAAIGAKWAPIGASNDPRGLNNHWTGGVSKFYKELGGDPNASIRIGKGGVVPAASPVSSSATGGIGNALGQGAGVAAQMSLQELARQAVLDTSDRRPLTRKLRGAILAHKLQERMAPAQTLDTGSVEASAPASSGVSLGLEASPTGFAGKLIGSPIDRPGQKTNQPILDFALKTSQIFGEAIQLGTGTSHNRMTTSGNVSNHWAGNALDLPATGDRLTKMGRAALVAAGMPAAQAAKQKGGVFNIGPYQILFNTNTGGNHYNHVHIGKRW